MDEDDSKYSIKNFLNNKILLALIIMMIFVWGKIFISDYMMSRSSVPNKEAPPAAARKEFLDPECNLPISYSSEYVDCDLENLEDNPKPTEAQMAEIRPLLPKETRIISIARLDVDPPIVFILHQPQPRTSSHTQLTLFRFKKDGIDSEDLGSYCFIPSFLIDQKGRAFADWTENSLLGNSWSSCVLKTMVIEKGQVSFPNIESYIYQVAKQLIMDQGEAVLLAWDTRYEFWEGLTHVYSPVQQTIFELNRDGEWTEATSRHRRLVEKWIQEDLKILKEAKASDEKQGLITAALNLYLDAENAGQVDLYRKIVLQALNECGCDGFIDLINTAIRCKCRLIDIYDASEEDDIDLPDLDDVQTITTSSRQISYTSPF